jgi:hypothetical protein
MIAMDPTTSDKPSASITTKPEDFPVIDFSSFKDDPEGTAAEIFNAASRWGFLTLQGHGISQQEIDEMFTLVYIENLTRR